jgi:hypothetical protein
MEKENNVSMRDRVRKPKEAKRRGETKSNLDC